MISGANAMVKGILKDDRIYVLISIQTEDCEALKKLDETVLEGFIKANVLLSFGAVGYMECPARVVYRNAASAQFIVQVTPRNLSKLHLIAANRFPTQLHIQLGELIGSSKPLRLCITRVSSNICTLIT